MRKVIDKIFGKKALYILCFVALCFIDFLRNTQTGDVWKAASNCTGLVLAVIVFSGYPLRQFCNVFSYVWTGICLLVIGYVFFFCGHFVFGDTYKGTFIFAVMNVWWLGIYIRYFAHKMFVEKAVRLKPGLLGWLWIALTFFMTFNVSGRLWPIWFFLMFGAFYMTKYTEPDFKLLAESMLDGTIIAFFIQQIYCYAFRPYDQIRYVGAYSNSNVASLHYLWVYTCCLIKLHFHVRKKSHWGWKLFYFVGAAGMLDFMIMTMCRSAWLSSIVLTILYGIVVVGQNWKKRWNAVLGRGFALLLTTVILFPVTFATVRYLPMIHPHPIWNDGEWREWKIHSWEGRFSEQYTDLDEFLEQLWMRLEETFPFLTSNPLVLKAQAAETDSPRYEKADEINLSFLDGAMNGRLMIYMAYLKDMTWFGHPETAGHYQLEGTDYVSWHAQDLWIQIAYSYGIPAGIVLLILTVVMVLFYWRQLYRNPDNIYNVIPLFICFMFFIFGLTEINWNVGQYPLFLIFFVQHPMFRKLLPSEKN